MKHNKAAFFLLVFACSFPHSFAFALTIDQYTRAVNAELDRIEGSLQAQGEQQGEAPTESVSPASVPAEATGFLDTSKWRSPEPGHQNVQVVGTDRRSEDRTIISKRHQVEISPEIYRVTYQQPKVMKQEGLLAGYNVSYAYRPDSKILNVFRVQGQWASGKFDYDSDDGLSHIEGKKEKAFEIRSVAGRDFNIASDIRATPYSGFGYRYLDERSKGLDSVVGGDLILGYDRTSHYYYLPLGLDVLYQLVPRSSLQGNLEFDYLIKGRQVSDLGVLPGYGTVKYDQRKGYGLRSSLRLNQRLHEANVFLEGFYRYWAVGQSNSVPDPTDPSYDLNEPKNNTQEVGIRFGLRI